MDAEEAVGIEGRFDVVHRYMQQMGCRSDVQADVVLRGFDAVDSVDGTKIVRSPAGIANRAPTTARADAHHARRDRAPGAAAHLERTNRAMVVRSHDDHAGHPVGANRLDHREAVHPRHLDVEQDQVRLLVANRGDGFSPVARFAD
jgi:hypothetical protein